MQCSNQRNVYIYIYVTVMVESKKSSKATAKLRKKAS